MNYATDGKKKTYDNDNNEWYNDNNNKLLHDDCALCVYAVCVCIVVDLTIEVGKSI